MTSGKEIPEFLLENDEIDRMIEERAGAFNLTGTNIRNILYVSSISAESAFFNIFRISGIKVILRTTCPENNTRSIRVIRVIYNIKLKFLVLVLP